MNNSTDMLGDADNLQQQLDRLVDGELNADGQRELLTTLESQPDGWRHCALAFIELQALRGDFRGMIAADETVKHEGSDRRHAAGMPGVRWLALAAMVMLAFTLGIVSRSFWPANLVNERAEKIVAAQPEVKATPPEQTVANSESAVPAGAADGASSKWQALKVTIPTADGMSEQTLQVPLVAAGEQEMKTMLEKQEPVLSEVARQALESTGHEVEQHRAYYAVQLEDGTQAVLPMDYVEVRDNGGWQ
ncbi:MAG TPA: hypothetical protein VGJ04_03335 [Pirellulales bacterium]|jgi:hypothetical protein